MARISRGIKHFCIGWRYCNLLPPGPSFFWVKNVCINQSSDYWALYFWVNLPPWHLHLFKHSNAPQYKVTCTHVLHDFWTQLTTPSLNSHSSEISYSTSLGEQLESWVGQGVGVKICRTLIINEDGIIEVTNTCHDSPQSLVCPGRSMNLWIIVNWMGSEKDVIATWNAVWVSLFHAYTFQK